VRKAHYPLIETPTLEHSAVFNFINSNIKRSGYKMNRNAPVARYLTKSQTSKDSVETKPVTDDTISQQKRKRRNKHVRLSDMQLNYLFKLQQALKPIFSKRELQRKSQKVSKFAAFYQYYKREKQEINKNKKKSGNTIRL